MFFTNGFSMHYNGPRVSRFSKKLKSAIANAEIIQDKINKEILAGRLAGPFSEQPFSNFMVFQLAWCQKRHQVNLR